MVALGTQHWQRIIAAPALLLLLFGCASSAVSKQGTSGTLTVRSVHSLIARGEELGHHWEVRLVSVKVQDGICTAVSLMI